MLGLDMLDVAVGVVFVYLLLSLIASAAAECWEAIWKIRAVYLERGLKELLRDGDLVAKLYNHPLINGLYRGVYGGDKNDKPKLPSYIPARSFALAIMDLLLSSEGTTPTPVPPDTTQSMMAARTTVDTKGVTMRPSGAQSSPPSALPTSAKSGVVVSPSDDPLINQARHAVITLANAAGNDAEQARKNIEDWYNNAMDRVSGWYKRRTQGFLFAIGLLVAIVLNVDSIHVVTALSTDKPKRDAIVGIATAYQREHPTPPASTPTTDTTASSANASSPALSAAARKTVTQISTAAPPAPNSPEMTSPATSTATVASANPVLAGTKAQTSAALGELNKLGLPIGWKNYGCELCEPTSAPRSPETIDSSLSFWDAIPHKLHYSHWLRCWLLVLVGWLITGLAVSLGAPFWFDMLNKIIVVRSTVKPQEKSGTEAPKDPQKK